MRQSLYDVFLACLFQRKSQAIEITRSLLLLLSCKNFNLAHSSKSIKGINTRLGILAHHDMVRGLTLKAIYLDYAPFLLKILSRMMAPDRQLLVLHVLFWFTTVIS